MEMRIEFTDKLRMERGATGRWVVAAAGILVALILATSATGAGTPGELDPSFSGDGRQLSDLGGADEGQAVAVQPDGKIVVAGTTDASGKQGVSVTRYNADGDLDAAFGGGDGAAVTTVPHTSMSGRDVAIQPDGKIVVAGSHEDSRGSTGSDFMAIRYLPDGELDESFAGDGIATIDFGDASDFGSGVAAQENGAVIVGGDVDGGSSSSDLAAARLAADGAPDASFSGDGRDTAKLSGHQSAADVAVDADGGAIVVAGDTTLPSSETDFALVRFGPLGGLDTSFAGDGVQTTDIGASDEISGVAIQSVGKLVAAGTAGSGPPDGDFAVARYRSGGGLDTAFSSDGKQTTDFGGFDSASDVAIERDGGVVAAGSSDLDDGTGTNRSFALARYDDAGGLDPTFSGDGRLTTDFGSDDDRASAVAIQHDGRIVAAGASNRATTLDDFALARYFGDSGSCQGLDATIIGTEDDDQIVGTLGPDVIDAGRGDDEVGALAGDDVVCGGAGDDSLQGADGGDSLLGQEGADGLGGGQGNDSLVGAKGRDTIKGANERDRLRGGAGGDLLRGGHGRDKLRGGSGFDNCKGGPGRDHGKGC